MLGHGLGKVELHTPQESRHGSGIERIGGEDDAEGEQDELAGAPERLQRQRDIEAGHQRRLQRCLQVPAPVDDVLRAAGEPDRAAEPGRRQQPVVPPHPGLALARREGQEAQPAEQADDEVVIAGADRAESAQPQIEHLVHGNEQRHHRHRESRPEGSTRQALRAGLRIGRGIDGPVGLGTHAGCPEKRGQKRGKPAGNREIPGGSRRIRATSGYPRGSDTRSSATPPDRRIWRRHSSPSCPPRRPAAGHAGSATRPARSDAPASRCRPPSDI